MTVFAGGQPHLPERLVGRTGPRPPKGGRGARFPRSLSARQHAREGNGFSARSPTGTTSPSPRGISARSPTGITPRSPRGFSARSTTVSPRAAHRAHHLRADRRSARGIGSITGTSPPRPVPGVGPWWQPTGDVPRDLWRDSDHVQVKLPVGRDGTRPAQCQRPSRPPAAPAPVPPRDDGSAPTIGQQHWATGMSGTLTWTTGTRGS